MDLRQFTQTPTYDTATPAAPPQQQSQQQQQQQQANRRPSISSMSSASGYASSSYGGGNTSMNAIHPNTTGNSLLSSRVTQSRHFGNSSTTTPNNGIHGASLLNNQNLQFNSTWLPQQNSNSMLNVTPWIEQQAQVSPLVNSSGPSPANAINMQSLSMSSLSPGENGNFNLMSPPLAQSKSSKAGPGTLQQQQQPQQSSSPNNGSSKASTPIATPTEELKEPPTVPLSTTSASTAKLDSTTKENAASFAATSSPHNGNGGSPATAVAGTVSGNANTDDDDLIPTAIVIKNIPFAIKKEQLLEVMTKLNLPLPYAFNYHFDNGVFRGLAFANFTSTDETTLVVTQLNGREIGGRKLRVEYKKMLPAQERERIEREKRQKRGQLEEQHRSTSSASLASLYSVTSAPAGVKNAQQQQPPSSQSSQAQAQQSLPNGAIPMNSATNSTITNGAPERLYSNLIGITPPWNLDFNDPDTLELYSQFLIFRDDKDRVHSELVYPASLTPNQRKVIPILANFMKLADSYENGLIILRRKISSSPNSVAQQLQNPLFRSQSQSSLGLLQQPTSALQNSRYRNSSGMQFSSQPQQPQQPASQQQSQQQQQQHSPQTSSIKGNFMNKSSSNLSSLRQPQAGQNNPGQVQQQQIPRSQSSQGSQQPPTPQGNGFLSQSSFMMSQPPYQQFGQFQNFQHAPPPSQHHHQIAQQQQQPPQHQKTYLDENLIASVENLTFN